METENIPVLNIENNTAELQLQKRSLAMAYVPYQEFEDLYTEDEALANGTLFKKLNLPFLGRRTSK